MKFKRGKTPEVALSIGDPLNKILKFIEKVTAGYDVFYSVGHSLYSDRTEYNLTFRNPQGQYLFGIILFMDSIQNVTCYKTLGIGGETDHSVSNLEADISGTITSEKWWKDLLERYGAPNY